MGAKESARVRARAHAKRGPALEPPLEGRKAELDDQRRHRMRSRRHPCEAQT